MAGTSHELEEQAARYSLDQGNLFTAIDLQRMGMVGLATLERLLGTLATGDSGPSAGVFGGVDGNHCRVTPGAGDLGWAVMSGMGLSYDAGAVGADPWVPATRLVVLDAGATGTLAPHSGSPRQDVIYLAPTADVADTPEDRKSKIVSGPSAGTLASPDPTVDVRRRRAGAVAVVSGTPGGAAPLASVPAGGVVLAIAHVPAGSGPTVFADARDSVQLVGARAVPPPWLCADHVVPTGGRLAVTHVAGVDFTVAPGYYVAGGQYRYSPGGTVTIPAAVPGASARIDIISIAASGTIVVTEGVPDLPPATAPVPPIGAAPLAEIHTAFGAVSEVRDVRQFSGIGPDQLQRGAIRAEHLPILPRAATISGVGFHADGPTSQLASAGSWSYADGAILMGTDGDTYRFAAPVQLPQGAVITDVTCVVASLGSPPSGAYTITLLRTDLSANTYTAAEELAEGTGTSPPSAGPVTRGFGAVASADLVDNTRYSYALRFELAAAGGAGNYLLVGARVGYDAPSIG